MKKDILIFCQAPADVSYLLTIYEKYKNICSISVFVINVEGIYKFLQSINLQLTQLVFIPYQLINLKQINLLLQEKRRINQIWEKYFSAVTNSDVYFFSKFEDWLTAAFIHRLAKSRKVTIYYVNHYDQSSLLYPKFHKVSFKHIIYLLILNFLTNVWFKAEIKEIIPEFPINKYPIKELLIEPNPEVFIKYLFKPNFDTKEKCNLLFFVAPNESMIFNPINYYNILIDITKFFKENGFNIILKGHPRAGIPELFSAIMDNEIPSFVPGEFIDTQNIDLILGLNTVTICHYAKNTSTPTYSLIKLFPNANKILIDVAIEYLNQQSENKIKYCIDFKELKEIAIHIKNSFNGRK